MIGIVGDRIDVKLDNEREKIFPFLKRITIVSSGKNYIFKKRLKSSYVMCGKNDIFVSSRNTPRKTTEMDDKTEFNGRNENWMVGYGGDGKDVNLLEA